MTTATKVLADVWNGHYAKPEGRRWWPSEAVVRALAGRRFDAAIEPGCGNGANLWLLAEHAETVTGVDGCRPALAEAADYMRRRGVSALLLESDIRSLPVHDMSHDLVLDCMTSQHVAWCDQRDLLAEYRRVLRPGGVLIRHALATGTTRDGGRLVDRYTYDCLPRLFPDVGPVCIPSEEALTGALLAVGFVVRSTIYSSREYEGGAVVARYSTLEAMRT